MGGTEYVITYPWAICLSMCSHNMYNIQRNTTLNKIYISSKIGHSTAANSIESSFKSISLCAYSRPVNSSKQMSEQELITQPELPFLLRVGKLDNHDGRNGYRFWIR